MEGSTVVLKREAAWKELSWSTCFKQEEDSLIHSPQLLHLPNPAQSLEDASLARKHWPIEGIPGHHHVDVDMVTIRTILMQINNLQW